MQYLKFFTLFLTALVISACNSSRYMEYEANEISRERAKFILEDLTWAQHPKFRPENVLVTDTFMSFNNGLKSVSNTHGRSATIGASAEIGDTGIRIGGSGTNTRSQTTTTLREDGERVYFRPTNNIRLISWKRNNRQWYIVRIFNSNRTSKNIYYTRNLQDAELYIDAFNTMVSYNQSLDENSNPEVTMLETRSTAKEPPNSMPTRDKYSELERLYQLKVNGALTEKEFEIEKQKILNH